MSFHNIVIWGAGRIGRGFIGDIFNNSGYEITFAEKLQSLVHQLNQRGSYRVVHALSSENIQSVDIRNYTALHISEKESILNALNNTSLIAVAVFPKDFPEVTRQLQEQLLSRMKFNSSPMNILLCTNLAQAGHKFSEMLFDGLEGDERQKLVKATGIIETLVIRICTNPPVEMLQALPVGIWTNGYSELPVDKYGFIGDIPDISEIRFVEDMRAEELRKIFTYNMFHAALAYHGHLAGYDLLVECLGDEHIRCEALGALDEVNQMLQASYGFSAADMDSWIADMITNTSNSTIGDTVFRLAADPLRKLNRDDRLIGPAMLCLESGIDPAHLINAAAAAFFYLEEEDLASIELQRLIKDEGIEKTVEAVCGLPSGDVIHERIVSACKVLGKGI